MTSRKPVVHVTGDLRELPAGDELEGALLAALTQVLGYTPANILEVEAATKAARVVYLPQVGASERELAFCVSRHAIGIIGDHNNLTTYAANTEVITAGNPGLPMVAFLRKVQVSALTSAISGARVGTCHVDLHEIKAMVAMGQTFQWMTPPLGTADAQLTNVADYKSLDGSQDPPQLIIQALRGTTGAAAAFTGIMSVSRLLGTAVGGAQSAIGTNIPPTVLFDHLVDGAFVVGPNTGFAVSSTYPAAATSQSIRVAVSLVWDEWQHRQPTL